MNMNLDNDIPKYKKKKESTTSKSNVKSKHKHEYIDCLLIHNNHPHKATYCKFCGKIDDIHFFETKELEGMRNRLMDDDEVFDKYEDLEQFEIDDIWQKYVPVTEKN